jgi:hypothetical protein
MKNEVVSGEIFVAGWQGCHVMSRRHNNSGRQFNIFPKVGLRTLTWFCMISTNNISLNFLRHHT